MSSQPSSPRSSHGLPSPPDSPDQYHSDAESIASNSSFPSVSVSSSFFFSSAAHSPHTQSEGGNSSEAANQGLIIPSLTLPEALHRPTPWGKTIGDLRVVIVDLGDDSSCSALQSQSQSPSHDNNMNTLVKTLLRENEDVVEVDADWEWDEVEHVPVRVLHASTDWIEHSDAHGLEKYDPTKNIQLLDVGANELQAIKRIVLAPFVELSNVLPSSSSSTSSSSIGLLANLISAPTTPLYTVLLLLLPSGAQSTHQPNYAEICQCLGPLVPILPVLIPSATTSYTSSHPSPQHQFIINPTYSPSYHHHRHPDHPLASSNPHHPAFKSGSRVQSGDALTNSHSNFKPPTTFIPYSSVTHSQPQPHSQAYTTTADQSRKFKPVTLPILRNMLFRPDVSSHNIAAGAPGKMAGSASHGSIVSLRSEAAELFLRWWRVEGIIQSIVCVDGDAVEGPGGRRKRDRQESTIMRPEYEFDGGERNEDAEGATKSGSWSVFKAKWEKEWERKWEGMEEELSRDVAVRLREVKGRQREMATERTMTGYEDQEEQGEGVEIAVEDTGAESRLEKAPVDSETPNQRFNEGYVESAPSESSAVQTASEAETDDDDASRDQSQASSEAGGTRESETDNENMDEGVIFQLDLSPRLPLPHSGYGHVQPRKPLPLNRSKSYSSLSSFEASYNHGLGLEDPREQESEDGDDEEGNEGNGDVDRTAMLSRTLTTKDIHAQVARNSDSEMAPPPPPPPPTSNTSPQILTSSSASPDSSVAQVRDGDLDLAGHKDMTPTSSVTDVSEAEPQLSPKTPRPLALMRASTVRDNWGGSLSGKGKGKMSTVRAGTDSGTIRRRPSKAAPRSRSTSPSNPSSPAFPPKGTGSSYSRRPGAARVKTKSAKDVNTSPSSSKTTSTSTGNTQAQVRYEDDDEREHGHGYPYHDHDQELLGLGFDPLHLPSLLIFSLSLFRPLRDRVRTLIVGSGSASSSPSASATEPPETVTSSPEASISTAVGQGRCDTIEVKGRVSSSIGQSRLSIFVVSLGVGVGLGYVIGRMNRVEYAV